MEVRLKKGTVITATTHNGHLWELDDTVIFTDKTENEQRPCYGTDGQKCYFPKDHDLSGGGFPEDMFDIK